ncbi:MAG TPA: cobalt transporter CbiM [Candidatus Lokiarchaeia archaeon]|nr:cobalt transporter CbiM [Candidatus Lokiarchaeia archaeon]
MHIPDGYLGPITWITMWVVMVPFWVIASRKLKKDLNTKQVPLLAIGAAFSFVIMMFNFPIPGGTTGHAVGGTLIAIVLGPWAAVVAETVALVIQALFFGDGGITCIATNCFNMGVVLPFVGYYIYKVITRNAYAKSKLQWIGAGIGSYVGINVAAICAGIELGLQTIIYPAVNGQYPYFMYGLSISIPAMALGHLMVYGVVEAVVTMGVVIYFQRTDPALLRVQVKTTDTTVIPAEASA